jgi:hypothetical protein
MDSESAERERMLPGPAMAWLERFEHSRLPAIAMEIVGQMLAVFIICCALVMFWFIGYGQHWYFGVDYNKLALFFSATMLTWLLGLLWLRYSALASGLPHYAHLFEQHNLLQLALGKELLTGGDGQGFRQRLQRMIRELPRLFRERGLRLDDNSPRMLFSLALVLLINFGPLIYFQSRMAMLFEFQALAALMLVMLLNFRERLGRLVRELAIARCLLGDAEAQDSDEAA